MTPDPDRIALSIQQPWAELILRGIKTVEVRRTPARPAGAIYLYASQRISRFPGLDSLVARHGIELESLPLGAIVGTVEILDCRSAREEDAEAAQLDPASLAGSYSWIVGNAVRLPQPLPPRFVPYGTWFYPFQRPQARTRHRSEYGGV